MIGGFNRWKDEGRQWSAPASLTPEQRNRYQRHLLLPEVGEVGQLKLLDSKVLLLGAGGLGSPAALYLAAAGVGTLGIIDMDVVDASNLQRQILHNTDRIGERKVDSAKKTLTLLNPDVNVVTYDVRLGRRQHPRHHRRLRRDRQRGRQFPTRYLVNDASLLKRIPVVHGSIFRFEGQATLFNPYVGPLLPVHDPRASSGRAGPELRRRPGCWVCCPASWARSRPSRPSSFILGIGEDAAGPPAGLDALEQSFRTFKVRRDPACPACGPNAAPDRHRRVRRPVHAPHGGGASRRLTPWPGTHDPGAVSARMTSTARPPYPRRRRGAGHRGPSSGHGPTRWSGGPPPVRRMSAAPESPTIQPRRWAPQRRAASSKMAGSGFQAPTRSEMQTPSTSSTRPAASSLCCWNQDPLVTIRPSSPRPAAHGDRTATRRGR